MSLTIDPAVPMKARDGTVLMNFVDIFLGAYGNYFDMEAKYARMKEGAPSPFIDPDGYMTYVNEREQAFQKELGRQQRSP